MVHKHVVLRSRYRSSSDQSHFCERSQLLITELRVTKLARTPCFCSQTLDANDGGGSLAAPLACLPYEDMKFLHIIQATQSSSDKSQWRAFSPAKST